MKQSIKKIILGPIDWFTYTVLTEEQRKKIGDMFSEEQKQFIRKIISGKKQAERKKLKQIKYHLYNLGFTKRAEKDLESYYLNAKDRELKRLAAWELLLWYANQNTEEGAAKALEYIGPAKEGVRDKDELRRLAVLEAEIYEKTGQLDKAKQVIENMLKEQKHADLFLALANLTESLDERFRLVNEVMAAYGLTPIRFNSRNKKPIYDDLETETIERKIDGPKVSVILPAYKAEEGIRVAIDSILSQTWQNLELLAVDDCSPDRTAEVIKEYAAKDSRVKFLQTPENSGPYIARNIALQQATGEFVTVNDADDWSHAEKIERQVTHLINNPSVIANTSEHARLTEDLTFYRRGTPGKYIFPNMSSIMFRREPVLEKLGYWDSVRFAADGEFKRRLLQAFGKNSYVDLNTGPLSLPRQSVSSLTASSAFGYNGFFMGVRKEYVEAFSHYHQKGETIRYPYPMEERLFSVPEPMWPRREEKENGKRHFNLVIATDFRIVKEDYIQFIREQLVKGNKRIGLVQLNRYGVDFEKTILTEIRELLDGDRLQMIVYGEHIEADHVIILHPAVLQEAQRYVPNVETKNLSIIIDELPEESDSFFQPYLEQVRYFFQQEGKWYPETDAVKEKLDEVSEIREYIPYEAKVWKKEWNLQ